LDNIQQEYSFKLKSLIACKNGFAVDDYLKSRALASNRKNLKKLAKEKQL